MRSMKNVASAVGRDPLVEQERENEPIQEQSYESDEDAILGGESARESDGEYFGRLRSAYAADTEALSEMITRVVVTVGLTTFRLRSLD